MSLTIKNELLANGMLKAINDLINVQFPADMGDTCWELALAAVEIEKNAKAYDKLAEKYAKAYEVIRRPIMDKYLNDKKTEFRDQEARMEFANNPEVKTAHEVLIKELNDLNSQEATYDFNRIIITKNQLKKLALKPVTLTLLMPILDIRD